MKDIRKMIKLRSCILSDFIHVRLVETLWTVACRLLCLWNFPGKNIEMGCHFLLQGIFLTQRLNPEMASESPEMAS